MSNPKETIEEKVDIETITIADAGEYKDPVSEEYITWRNNRRNRTINEWGNIEKWRPFGDNPWNVKKTSMIPKF